jgi:hypothetical protein
MGDEMLGARQGNVFGHWESVDFLKMNQAILKAAGGSWHHPPSHEEIMAVEPQFREKIELLVARYAVKNDKWGWKDPRTCLTIELYHRFLSDPHYIVTQRDTDEVAGSLLRRHEPVYECQPHHWYLDFWAMLAEEYKRRYSAFLKQRRIYPLHVSFDTLLDRRKAYQPINAIADLVGAKPQSVRKAFNQVRFRV